MRNRFSHRLRKVQSRRMAGHPLPGMPEHPQPPPAPFAGTDDYKTFSIPNIRKRTAAKTNRGRERFRKHMQQTWSDRKRLYTCGIKLLRDADFSKHTRSIDGPADRRNSCPRCGCSVFVPKGKKNRPARFLPGIIYETLSCYDCGYVQGRGLAIHSQVRRRLKERNCVPITAVSSPHPA